ncbi:MAG: ABC transporter permease [Pusillimonas sp.]|jgi:ribose transport system permease protein|nr:ABC transporter permease [Pusillimonas sp.]|tara:strand:- start:143609 stop:144631 length:1023 start_codon:yes stop_codon:yes gene_type:complete
MSGVSTQTQVAPASQGVSWRSIAASIGMMPLLLLALIVLFGFLEPRFVSEANLFNLTRQSTYLIIVCVAQFLILITGGIDLSVGSNVALVSVVTATVMKYMLGIDPEAVNWAVTVAIVSGVLTGAGVGLFNGLGVALFRVTPFVMTLGSLSIASGLALYISGGYSISGLPEQFGNVLAYDSVYGIPVPILYAAVIVVLTYVLLSWTRFGRYFYAIGSNFKAARLSGVRTSLNQVFAYVVAGTIVGIGGVLLTARTESGEATLGGTDLILNSIAACLIAGVSLTGGRGLLRNVVMGAIFITALSNGMNLLRVNSYLQTIIIGAVLVIAIAVDQMRDSNRNR